LHVAKGVPPDEARTIALRQIGGLESQREQCRDARGVNVIDHLIRDIRGGARLLVRQPSVSVVAVVSLALGIGANATIFQLLDAVRLRPLPVESPKELAIVDIANRGNPGEVGGNYAGRYAAFTSPLWNGLRNRHEPFSGVLAWSHATMDLSAQGESHFVENGLYVSGSSFPTLGIGAAAGRVLGPADDAEPCPARSVVLSHAFWTRQYAGAAGAIGTTLTLDGKPFTIVGVAAQGFHGVEVGRSFDLAIPLCAQSIINPLGPRLTNRSMWWLGIMGRLKPGWTREAASANLAAASSALFAATIPPEASADQAARYRSFTLAATPGASGFSQLRVRYDASLWLLLGVAGLVLLIACANLANLLLARMSAREREMAVRLAIGASRPRLIQQLLIESLMLAAAGTVAAAVLAPMLGRIVIDLRPDWRVIGFLASLGGLATLLFGLTPALRAARVPPGSVIQGGGRGVVAGAPVRLRRALVVSQVALSLVLLVAGLLFTQSLRNLIRTDMGFTPEGIVEADVDMRALDLSGPERSVMRDAIVRNLRELPDVASVATVASVPFVGNWWRSVYVTGPGGTTRAMGRFNRVSPGYFETVGTPLVIGRDFDAAIDTPSAPRVAVVNQTFVRKYLEEGTPIGAEFRPEGARNGEPGATPFRVIGVVKDTKHGSLREEFDPIVYVAESQLAESSSYLNIFIRPRTPGPAVTDGIRSALTRSSSRLAFHFHDVGEITLESIAQDRLLALLCGAFAVVGAVLATVGVYGVIAYSVARRRSEIGVRLALGARRASIVRLVISEAAGVVGIGAVVGMALAAITARLAGAKLYGLDAFDPATLFLATALLFTSGLVAAYLPAIRASRTNPTVALRQ